MLARPTFYEVLAFNDLPIATLHVTNHRENDASFQSSVKNFTQEKLTASRQKIFSSRKGNGRVLNGRWDGESLCHRGTGLAMRRLFDLAPPALKCSRDPMAKLRKEIKQA